MFSSPLPPHQCRVEGFNSNSMKDCSPLSTRGPQFIQQTPAQFTDEHLTCLAGASSPCL